MNGLVTHILYESPAVALAQWIQGLHSRRFSGAKPSSLVPTDPSVAFRDLLLKELTPYSTTVATTAVDVQGEEATGSPATTTSTTTSWDPSVLHLCVMVLWNGTDPKTQSDLQGLREFIVQIHSKGCRVTMQAINAKQGTHNFYKEAVGSPKLQEVESNIFDALQKKVLAMEASAAGNVEAGKTTGGNSTAPDQRNSTPGQGAAPVEEPPLVVAEGPIQNVEDLVARVTRNQGELFYSLLCAVPTEYEATLESLRAMAKASSMLMTPVYQCPEKGAAELLFRVLPPAPCIDIRIAVCGNVDSGKSTLTSVLTRQMMDDGRGAARSKVFNHKHELDTGRTSSISEQYLAYNEKGEVVNFYSGASTKEELKGLSRKIITFFDLAGHERYLKTTVLGMTRSVPDYAVIVISANNGIQRMTKEHLALCLALKIPFFVVITRIDATPDNVRMDTINTVVKTLRHPTVRKLPLMVRTMEDVIIAAKNIKTDKVTPIFEVSNVTGQHLDLIYHLLNYSPSRYDWVNAMQLPSQELVVDSTFYVTGVGTVVGGIVTQGTFHVGDNVVLGPDGNGQFRQTQIKSIHSKSIDVTSVSAGSDATLALKKEKKANIRKGMVVLGGEAAAHVTAYWEFEAEVLILYHSTTISNNYEPVIHSSTVRQSARIQLTDREVLRTGDKARVRFRFLYRPEFMKVGQKLVFREGRTKGLGTVTSVYVGGVPGQAPAGGSGAGGKSTGDDEDKRKKK
eukprot:PhF_6_TR40162/c0_g1_i1/m.59466